MTDKIKGRVRVYACGGTGVNIASITEQFREVSEPGTATIETVYIDTSRSNLNEYIPDAACYIFDGMDGSGQIRKENHGEISARIRDILQRHEPLDLSIVISSASGGSGSVIAPSIVSELLERDLPVAVIAIGATESRLDIDNTLKTIKSYAQISNLRAKPVNVAYFQNSAETPRAAVDTAAGKVILALAMIFSREHSELDSKDLFNVLRYERATTYSPQLSGLHVFLNEFPQGLDESVITVASVGQLEEDTPLPFTPDFQRKGFLTANVSAKVKALAPVHLVITANLFQPVVKNLNDRLEALAQAQRARVAPVRIVNDADKATDDGLIL